MTLLAETAVNTWAKTWDGAMRAMRAYHSYQVYGLETFPRSGPALVVGSHSLATYETFMLGSLALDILGRRPYILADDKLCGIPVVGGALAELGIIPGKRDKAMDILRSGDLLGVGPGGMREALRSSQRKYQVDWTGRHGFLWVAMQTGAPVILAACPRADDIFKVYETPITPWMYRNYHLPLPLFRGIGPTPLPRPVKIWHLMSEPIVADVAPDRVTKADVLAFHDRIVRRMNDLIQEALAYGD